MVVYGRSESRADGVSVARAISVIYPATVALLLGACVFASGCASPRAVADVPATQAEPELVEGCEFGMVRPGADDAVGCCWPGQVWDTSASACAGEISCPAGSSLARGVCVADDPASWAGRACERHDDMPSCERAAALYKPGASARSNPALYAKYVSLACERGALEACLERASLAERGVGKDVDLPSARADYMKVCDESGDASACARLGEMAAAGLGGDKSVEIARRAHERACYADVASSCEQMARMWRFGVGGERDRARGRALPAGV